MRLTGDVVGDGGPEQASEVDTTDEMYGDW